ncbi:uncharacterized protein LOC119085993 [Bradysia coprophila]|uniref:uncharacterized protein LOC119085993 n=1 Tax=Bradysia coprophila TaxID=38358 RepID=UPI00187DB56F|nr:uncharacterized protein LOC119085993 [Bradysia coprophila]
MPVMKEFCFYCSVRLGSIIVGTVSIFQAIIPLCILLANGADNLRENAIYIQTHPNEYNKQNYFDMLLTYLRKDAETFMLIATTIIGIYLAACLLIIIGAYKIWKWLLWPYIFLELFRILIILALLIVGLVILKDKIDLGLVIGITIGYGFALLFLFYMWTCVISLYQIISIIHTQNYKSLYGDDPLAYNEKPTPITPGKKPEIENVTFFSSSDFTNYSPIKQRDYNSNSRLVTTISIASPTDIFEKDFSNLQNHMGSRNRLIGMVFYNGQNGRQKF